MRGLLEERWPELVTLAGIALLWTAIVIAWL